MELIEVGGRSSEVISFHYLANRQVPSLDLEEAQYENAV